MKIYFIIFCLFISMFSLAQSRQISIDSVPEKILTKHQLLFPELRENKWTVSTDYYMAESNFLTHVPDSIQFRNGYATARYINGGTEDGEWYSSYRQLAEIKEFEKYVPLEILSKIREKLIDLGNFDIGNIGIISCSKDCTIPSGAKYAVFAVNSSTNKTNRYYFTDKGDFIKWR
jgi:hypothetical protein